MSTSAAANHARLKSHAKPERQRYAAFPRTRSLCFAFARSPAFDAWSTGVLIVNTLAVPASATSNRPPLTSSQVLVESYYDLADTLTPAGEEAWSVQEISWKSGGRAGGCGEQG